MHSSVVHFSTTDNFGGSGRAAYRIHAGLRNLGYSSRMIVGRKVTDDKDVDTVRRTATGTMMDRIADRLLGAIGLQYAYFPSQHRVLGHPWVQAANVFQLYNIHGGYFSTSILPALSALAPIVWRLSDMWAFTGHCAYAGTCDRWRTGCGECPDLATYPGIGIDTTRYLWQRKSRIYRRLRMVVVAPSTWTERLAKESPLLGDFPVRRIPNGLDLQIFRPANQADARKILGLNPEEKIVLFSAQLLDSDARKGTAHVIEALQRYALREGRPNTSLLLVGSGGEHICDKVPLPVRYLGFIDKDEELARAYSAADIMLAPSLAENLPNSALEAMACGIPVVAYATGGVGDAVRHMETGFLAESGDAGGLDEGISLLLTNEDLRNKLASQALDLIRSEFAAEIQANRFASLYQELIETTSHARTSD